MAHIPKSLKNRVMQLSSRPPTHNMGRTEREILFDLFAKKALPEQKSIVNKRLRYRMPPGYITKEALDLIGLGCFIISCRAEHILSVCKKSVSENLYTNFAFSNCFELWARSESPLYCVTEPIMQALAQTDSLSKKSILRDFNLPLYDLMIALPQNQIHCPVNKDAYLDFLLVNCLEPTEKRNSRIIGVFSVSTDGDTWAIKTEIDAAGNIISDNADASAECVDFFNTIRNLVLGVILLIETSTTSLVSEVTPSETVEDTKKPKGFGKTPLTLTPPPKYPRWIGKNYQIKSQRQQRLPRSHRSHSSPRPHWRSGHFRRLEPGEGRKWIEPKIIWIEPVFINCGID